MATRPDGVNVYNNAMYVEGVTKRFKIKVRGYEPEDEPDWQYKLVLIDHKYLDCDHHPVDAIAAGYNWEEAYKTAADFIEAALADNERCVFV